MSTPHQKGTCTSPCHYDEDGLPTARGTRPLFWKLGMEINGVLQGAPAGMVVEPATGAIKWTPDADQTREHPVILVASNEAGAVSQHFAISVDCEDKPIQGEGCKCSHKGSTPAGGLWILLLGVMLRRGKKQ